MVQRADADPTGIPIQFDPQIQRMRGTAVHGNTPFDVPFMSEIADNLYTGGCQRGLVLPSHIEHLVSLYRWEAYAVPHTLKSSLTVEMYDSHGAPDLRDVALLAQWVNRCRSFGPTLVHCQAGLNRSGLIAAAALCVGGMSPSDAIRLLRDKRSPAVLCNQSFEKFIIEFGNLL